MKIEARNAYTYIQHIKLLAYLSGKEEAADLLRYAYSTTGEEIYAKLRRIEASANRAAVLSCNGDLTPEQEEKQDERTRKQVEDLLPRLSQYGGLMINGDPRGYTLKIYSEKVEALKATGLSIYTDFGGYGILAPDF